MATKFILMKVAIYSISINWTVWLIVKSFGTNCFSFFDTYATIFTLIDSMVVNDLMR